MKKRKNEIMNLIFSAFLVTAFLICSAFFLGMIKDSFSQDAVKSTLLTALIFALFGGLLFYATRVGDGKQVFRFSAGTLIIMVLPALYVIIASVVQAMPLHEQISTHSELANIAAVIFGYGLPYTFLSGYELDTPKEDDNKIADTQPVSEEQISEQEISDAFDELAKTVPDVSGESDSEENKDTKGRILSNRIH